MILQKRLKQILQIYQQNNKLTYKSGLKFASTEDGDNKAKSSPINNSQKQDSRDNINQKDSEFRHAIYTQKYQQNAQRQNQLKQTPHFDLKKSLTIDDQTKSQQILQTYQRLCDEGKFNSAEFKSIRVNIIMQIQMQTSFKFLTKYFKNLNKYEFNDRVILNALAGQASKLKVGFESLELNIKMNVSSVLCSKYHYIDKEHHSIVLFMLNRTLQAINQQKEQTYKSIEFGLNSLAKIYVTDKSLYDNLITSFQNNIDSFTDYQFVSLISKTMKLIDKLKMNEHYQITSKVISQRIKNFMLRPKTVERILKMTRMAIEDNNSNSLNIRDSAQFIVGKVSVILSKQMSVLVNENKVNLSQKNSGQEDEQDNDDDVLSEELLNNEVSLQYQQAWKNIEEFILKYYKTFNDLTFRTLLLAIVSARGGSENLYSVLFQEFYKRVTSVPAEKVNNDFYCLCLRSFYTSRTSQLLIEDKQEKTLSEYTKKKLDQLNAANKMTIFMAYSTTGDESMIRYILDNNKFTLTEINQLNTIGRIQFFWSMANIKCLKEEFYHHFLLQENDPSDSFFGQSPKYLVQVTQIFQIVKVTQPEFWKKHKEILDQKLQAFADLTYFYHTLPTQTKSEYQRKTIGSFDIADILNAMEIEFYFEPIVDKIFNVDFILKGINEAKIEELVAKKVAIMTKFKELQYQESRQVPKFNQKTHRIAKKNDILLEIDGKNHIVTKGKTRQATNCKIDILQRIGYKVIQINNFELQKIAQQSDKRLVVESIIKLLQDQIQTKSFIRVPKENLSQQDNVDQLHQEDGKQNKQVKQNI